MFNYKVSYSDYDDYGFIYLQHERKFSNSELNVMINECIRELLENKEYDNVPCLYRASDLFNHYNDKFSLFRKMVKKFGFRAFHFDAVVNLDNDKFFREGGIAEVYDVEPYCEHCSFEDCKSHWCPLKKENDE